MHSVIKVRQTRIYWFKKMIFIIFVYFFVECRFAGQNGKWASCYTDVIARHMSAE